MSTFPPQVIESISKILVIEEGISHSKISDMLGYLKLPDYSKKIPEYPYISPAKWRRLTESIYEVSQKKNSNQPLFDVIEYIAIPSNYIGRKKEWDSLLSRINAILITFGYNLNDSGKIVYTKAAKTFSEAQLRLKALNSKLQGEDIHKEVLKWCQEELFVEDYFHAVFEASKGLLDRIRSLVNSSLDGSKLIEEAFKIKNPAIIIRDNKLESETELSEYKGLKTLLKTIVSLYRNPKAHTPRIYDYSDENYIFTAFIILSLAHTYLDECIPVRILDN